jgi:hypothetical protein
MLNRLGLELDGRSAKRIFVNLLLRLCLYAVLADMVVWGGAGGVLGSLALGCLGLGVFVLWDARRASIPHAWKWPLIAGVVPGVGPLLYARERRHYRSGGLPFFDFRIRRLLLGASFARKRRAAGPGGSTTPPSLDAAPMH